MSLRRLRAVVLFAIALSCCCSAFSQRNPAARGLNKVTPDGRFTFLQLDTNSPQKTDPSPNSIKRLIGLGNKHELIAEAKLQTSFKDNRTTVSQKRYQQYFKGIKVEFAILTAHAKLNTLQKLSGEYFNVDENFSVIPAINESAALQYAINFMPSELYSWQEKVSINPLLQFFLF